MVSTVNIIMLIRVPTSLYSDVSVFMSQHSFEHGRDYQFITSVALESFFINFPNDSCYDQFISHFKSRLEQ
jgi:hypothetical protein